MIQIRYIPLAALLVALFAGLLSCSDDSDHYDRSGSLPDKNLLQLISEDPALSIFTKLVETAGYDTLLSSTQTMTVFAPVNESFNNLNINSISRNEARLIAGNHIARFNNSTSTPENKLIRMIDKKIYTFSGGGSSFGNSDLKEKDILAKNGILHVLASQIPYHNNLHEHITTDPNTTKLGAFISSFYEERFNESLSIPIDIDDSGRTVYDTVTTPYNRLFDSMFYGLGNINTEDSLYTMLIPTDQAWDKIYEKVSPYFKFPVTAGTNIEYADSVRRVQTSLAILEDLIYRSKISDPASRDSLVSTSPSVLYNTAELFSGATMQIASNGLIFSTDELRYDNTRTWNKPIRVEADLPTGRVTGANTAIDPRTIDNNTEISASENRYIHVLPTTTSAQASVTFQIPQVLSGKYDIYVEFIPESVNGNPKDSTKLLFELTYRTASGGTASKMVNTPDLVTSGTKKVKMKAFSLFDFPVSNYYDRLWYIDYYDGKHSIDDIVVSTKLMVRSNVSSSEVNQKYTRRFNIDRIIFEPVKE